MDVLEATIPIGLGDAIYIKAMLDIVKYRYSQIKLRFHREIITSYHMDPEYNKFLNDIGDLFFSVAPYKMVEESSDFYGIVDLCRKFNLTPTKPNLSSYLCKGNALNLNQEYIVIPTKIRYMERAHFNSKSNAFWATINKLSQKYKVVILGERVVEQHGGYAIFSDFIFGIYDEIRANVPAESLIDLSIPKLGITAPSLTQIQQDCLIMSKAKFIITHGVGGSFCMATAVGNVIGYRWDDDPIADVVFDKEYNNAIITKNWDRFMNILVSHV